jgi:hypothetical protein
MIWGKLQQPIATFAACSAWQRLQCAGFSMCCRVLRKVAIRSVTLRMDIRSRVDAPSIQYLRSAILEIGRLARQSPPVFLSCTRERRGYECNLPPLLQDRRIGKSRRYAWSAGVRKRFRRHWSCTEKFGSKIGKSGEGLE